MKLETILRAAAVVALAASMNACGGAGDESEEGNTDGDASNESPTESVDTVESGISCMWIIDSWKGGCQQWNYKVLNMCQGGHTVRVRIDNGPDTSCKWVGVGEVKTFTTGCWKGWDQNSGVVLC